jgi:hypothetical protein
MAFLCRPFFPCRQRLMLFFPGNCRICIDEWVFIMLSFKINKAAGDAAGAAGSFLPASALNAYHLHRESM